MTRSNISPADRVDAVVAAVRIFEHVREDRRNESSPGFSEPWSIVEELRATTIDRALIRKWLDVILEARFQPAHLTAYVRVEVCKLENACGLHHDDRSVEAFLAKPNRKTWHAYVDRMEAETGVAIEIPVRPAPQEA